MNPKSTGGSDNTNQQYCNLPIDGFIRLSEVLAILGVKKTTFQKGVREGTLPKPYKFGPRISLWSIEEIKLVVERIKTRNYDKGTDSESLFCGSRGNAENIGDGQP